MGFFICDKSLFKIYFFAAAISALANLESTTSD
jgi:hypothetical protein